MDRGEDVVGPPRVGIERRRVAERSEIGAALAVSLDPGEAVVLIGARALGAEAVGGGAIGCSTSMLSSTCCFSRE